MNLKGLLEGMRKVDASDLHLKVGTPPVLRIHSRLRNVDHPPLTNEDVSIALSETIPERLQKAFAEEGIVDYAHDVPGLGRFRVAAFHQAGRITLVFRYVKPLVPVLADLNLPASVAPLVRITHGLVLVTGVTGSGKTTTLAALIEEINRARRCHIITIEDPIEYVYEEKKAIINQMEVGRDCPSFRLAMQRILRFDPDIILVGEIRNRETMEAALEAVETGQLVFGTLHTSDAKQTVNRVISFFTKEEEGMVRSRIANGLRAVISQRLLPRIDQAGLIPVCEVMLNISIVQKLIREDRVLDIQQALMNREAGMQAFDVSLAELVRAGRISDDDALNYCSDEASFRRMLRGESTASEQGALIGGNY